MESHQVHGRKSQTNSYQSATANPTPTSTPPEKKKDRKTAVLVILIVLLAIAVGALAYLLMDEKKSSNDTPQTPAASQEDKEGQTENVAEDKTSPVDPTTDWKTLSNETYGVSFEYPSSSDWTANITDWALSTGQRATGNAKYLPCGPNCGWALNLRIITKGTSDDPGMTYGDDQFQGNDYYRLASKKDIVKDGVSGVRWEFAPADNNAATIVYYYFAKDDFAYAFEVNMNGSKTDSVDITKTGEMIMDTLQFDA